MATLMLHMGAAVAHTRYWWWWGGCALTKHDTGRGVGPKPETELLWLGLWHVQGSGSGDGGGLCAHETRHGEGGWAET